MWCQVQATSALTGAGCPLVRSKHAMCTTADGHIYLYGGRSMANKPLRDLWRFDTAQDVWEEVVPRVDGVQTPQCCGRGAPSAQSSTSYSSSSSSSSSSASSSAENSPNSGNALAENKYEPPPALQEHTIVAARVSKKSKKTKILDLKNLILSTPEQALPVWRAGGLLQRRDAAVDLRPGHGSVEQVWRRCDTRNFKRRTKPVITSRMQQRHRSATRSTGAQCSAVPPGGRHVCLRRLPGL